MFGRLKLVLVALVLMPSAAFAADQGPRHASGAAVESTVVATKVAVPAAERSRKHHSAAKAEQPEPSTIAMFLDRLREQVADAPAGAKQAAASVPAAATHVHPVGHQRN